MASMDLSHLPHDDVLTLASDIGQRLLDEAKGDFKSDFEMLWPHWKKQVGRRNCGLASTAQVVSSAGNIVHEDQVLKLYGQKEADAEAVGVGVEVESRPHSYSHPDSVILTTGERPHSP